MPIKFATAVDFNDLSSTDVNVHLTGNTNNLTFGVQKDANGSNWHFAQIASIVYSNSPDLTALKETRDQLVAEAQGLLASSGDYLTSAQKTALQDAITAGNNANTFDALNTVTLTTLPNAINTAKQQIAQAKAAIPVLHAALERFERDYNLVDGTDYRRIDDITAMWAYAEARLDDSRSRIERVGHFDNAYCSPRPGNRTVLCFSRKTNDQDTAGHEFTHAVTQETVDWIAYRNTTGAVNESFSDIFAKFVRWAWEGRELHDSQRWIYGGIRDMAHPDRLRNEKADWYPASYYLQKPTAERPRSGWFPTDSDFDHGGVHLNNGVIARLCFLLCEGEKVVRDNGWTGDVRPIGFERTEELFGTLLFAKRRYLPRATTMHALCNGILLAARDLEFGSDEFRRLRMACDAVNILPKESAGSRHGPAERHVAMKADNARSAGGESSAARSVAAAFAEELGLDAPGAGYVVAGDAPLGPPGRFPEDRAWGDPEEREVVLEQTWRGIPVYGASAIARVREGVATYLQNGFSRSLGRLGGAKDRIGADGAGRIALERSAGGHVARLEQVVWDPAVLEEAGVPALAWHVETAVGDAPEKQWVIDAESGAILLEAPLRTS